MPSVFYLVLVWLLSHFTLAAGDQLPKVVVEKGKFWTQTTEKKQFIPLGVNYFRPGTGWAPQVWKQFDAEKIRQDFRLMKTMGVTCVRIFLTFGSFYSTPNTLDMAGIQKFEQLLDLAEECGIYIHPTGLDHWEGTPKWLSGDPYASEEWISAREQFWQLFVAHFKNRNVIFAYDLLNEPSVGWQGKEMEKRWNQWVVVKYGGLDKAVEMWKTGRIVSQGRISVPDAEKEENTLILLDYQHFRESLANEWTRRQAIAIKTADPHALVTVGLIQWSIPVLLPQLKMYSGFHPQQIARYLDFLEVHFYPLASGFYGYESIEAKKQNLGYLHSVVKATAVIGKPVVLAEFGWYGGGKLTIDQGRHPEASEQQQAEWCSDAVKSTRGLVSGWLNWGLYDHPEARDVTQLTGLLTSNGKMKAWGKMFISLQSELSEMSTWVKPSWEDLDWDKALIDRKYAEQYRKKWHSIDYIIK